MADHIKNPKWYGLAIKLVLTAFAFSVTPAPPATAAPCSQATAENQSMAERFIWNYLAKIESGSPSGFFRTFDVANAKKCGNRLIITYYPAEGVLGTTTRFKVNLSTGRVARRFLD